MKSVTVGSKPRSTNGTGWGLLCLGNPIVSDDDGLTILFMAKKTGMSGSTLWIVTIVLLALGAWMYFKR
jgi:hypothetical protein